MIACINNRQKDFFLLGGRRSNLRRRLRKSGETFFYFILTFVWFFIFISIWKKGKVKIVEIILRPKAGENNKKAELWGDDDDDDDDDDDGDDDGDDDNDDNDEDVKKMYHCCPNSWRPNKTKEEKKVGIKPPKICPLEGYLLSGNILPSYKWEDSWYREFFRHRGKYSFSR